MLLAASLLGAAGIQYAINGFSTLACLWQFPLLTAGMLVGLVLLFLLVLFVSTLFVDPKKMVEKPSAYFRFMLNQFCRLALFLGGVRVHVTGLEQVPLAVQKKLQQCERDTIGNTKMTLVVALSYSSRWEISAAARNIAADVKQGTLEISQIDEETFSKYLATAFMPDPELMIRTGGELRLSNYLLWQCAYSELYFCDTYWPDFKEEDFQKAIADYQQRQRRFGKTGEQMQAENPKTKNETEE